MNSLKIVIIFVCEELTFPVLHLEESGSTAHSIFSISS